MADALTGVPTGQDAETTIDYLGRPAAISFRGQPALPQVGGGPASLAATASPSVAGSGVLAPPTSFGDVAKSIDRGAPQEQGGDGGGVGGSSPVGPGSSIGSIPSLHIGEHGISTEGRGLTLGLTGNIGINTGHQTLDTVLNAVLGQGARAAGATTSLPGVLAMVTGSPVLGMIAGAMSLIGVPLTVANLGAFAASLNPNSIQSQLNALQSNPNVTAEDFASMMAQIAQGFPTEGGPQQALGVPGSFQGPSGRGFGTGGSVAPTTPALSFADMFSGGLFGGGRTGGVQAPTPDPTLELDVSGNVPSPNTATGTGGAPGPGTAGPGAGTAGPTGSDVGESGGSASEG